MGNVQNNVSMINLAHNRTKVSESVNDRKGLLKECGGIIAGGTAGGIGGYFVGSKIQSFFEKRALWQSAERYGVLGFTGTMFAGALLGDFLSRTLNKYA